MSSDNSVGGCVPSAIPKIAPSTSRSSAAKNAAGRKSVKTLKIPNRIKAVSSSTPLRTQQGIQPTPWSKGHG